MSYAHRIRLMNQTRTDTIVPPASDDLLRREGPLRKL